jgi:cysteine-rich repeat protein
MSVHLRAARSWLVGLSVLLALPSAAIAGKQHCRTIELTGAAGPASSDVVDVQVTDYLGNILDRSCKVTVQADECADALAERLISQWGNGSEDLSQVGCATDLGDRTCGKNLDMDACILDPLDPTCTVFCKHKFKKGKVKGGNAAIDELAMLGQCPAAPPNGEKADRGEFKKFPKIEICCFEAADQGVLADPSSFVYTESTHCKGKPLGKTLTSPQRIEISLFDRIDRPNVIGDGIFFDPKLVDNSLDVPVGVSSRQISLDPIGFIQRPGTNLLDCRADVMKGVDSLIRTTVGVLTRCHAAVMAGASTADCNTVNAQSDPVGRIAEGAQLLRTLAIENCEGPDLASEGPRTSPSVYGLRSCPAPCDSIDLGVCSFGLFGNSCVSDRDCDTSPGAADGKCGSWSDAADCSACLVENAVTTSVADLFGSPGPAAGTAPDAAACLNALGSSLEFLAKVNGTETLGCQKKADRAKVALPADAPYCKDADLRGSRNKAYAKTGAVAEKSCVGVDVASLSICGGATSATDLQTCLRSNAMAINDSLARAALPEQIDLCGNDNVDPGEECDGIDGLCPGACLPDCTCPQSSNCGNAVAEPGEQCDDGNTNNNDGCTNGCNVAICGDNIHCSSSNCGSGPGGGPEACDGTDDAACPGACQSNCSCLPPPICPEIGNDSNRACIRYTLDGTCRACCDAAPGGCNLACLMAENTNPEGCSDVGLNLECTVEVNQVCAVECCQ